MAVEDESANEGTNPSIDLPEQAVRANGRTVPRSSYESLRMSGTGRRMSGSRGRASEGRRRRPAGSGFGGTPFTTGCWHRRR